MTEQEIVMNKVFFKPRDEHDTMNTAYLLWKIAGGILLMPNGCWVWQGSKDQRGYGKIGVSKKDWLLHRLIYELCVAHVVPSQLVCHKCPGGDNTSCCNPSHLYAGSASDNQRDAVERGNHYLPCPKGGKKARKLTDDAIRDIRRSVDAGGKGITHQMALKYGVSDVLISNVIHRRRYASVPDYPEGGVQ